MHLGKQQCQFTSTYRCVILCSTGSRLVGFCMSSHCSSTVGLEGSVRDDTLSVYMLVSVIQLACHLKG